MKKLLIINDQTTKAVNAAKFALLIAQKAGFDIVLANTQPVKTLQLALAGHMSDKQPHPPLLDQLNEIGLSAGAFRPVIHLMDISAMNEVQLAQFVHAEGIELIVKGEADEADAMEVSGVKMQAVLNRVCCPLLLVPAKWAISNIQYVTYLADLRYCRIRIVQFLTRLAKPFKAAISVLHFSAKGLPHMEQHYAEELFKDSVQQQVRYEELFLNNTRERDLSKAVDVLIHGLHHNLLVLVNRGYHFDELIGRYLTGMLPKRLTVPVMIFPS